MHRDSTNLRQNDKFGVFLDTFHDRRNGYLFYVSPVGGMFDGATANERTYNTDFAQVEVDEAQVNLTRFNLQFPEKRDFFLEGRAIQHRRTEHRDRRDDLARDSGDQLHGAAGTTRRPAAQFDWRVVHQPIGLHRGPWRESGCGCRWQLRVVVECQPWRVCGALTHGRSGTRRPQLSRELQLRRRSVWRATRSHGRRRQLQSGSRVPATHSVP